MQYYISLLYLFSEPLSLGNSCDSDDADDIVDLPVFLRPSKYVAQTPEALLDNFRSNLLKPGPPLRI